MNIFLQFLGNGIIQGAADGLDRSVFLSHWQIKAKTNDSKQFLNATWLAQNYFE